MKTNFLIILFVIAVTISCNSNNKTTKRDNIIYYPTGELYRKYQTVDNLPHGRDSIFYKSGNLKATHQWVDSTLVHEGHEYYDKTSPMLVAQDSDTLIMTLPTEKNYCHYNSYGKIAFEAKYSGDSIILLGESIATVYLDTLENEFISFTAFPPLLNSQIIISVELDTEITYSDTVTMNSTKNELELEGIPFDKIIYTHILYNADIRHSDSLTILNTKEGLKMERN